MAGGHGAPCKKLLLSYFGHLGKLGLLYAVPFGRMLGYTKIGSGGPAPLRWGRG